MNKVLWKKEWKSNWKILVIFGAVLTLYTTMIISMFDPKLGESLNMMLESMPQLFSAFGMSSPGTTLLDFIINYLYGFLYLVFPMVFFILLVNRLIIRYTDRGSMVWLLSSPNSRRRIIVTQAIVLLSQLFVLLVYVVILSILSSMIMFPEELETGAYLWVNVGLYGLWFFLSGLCFLSACLFSDSGKALSVGAGLCILFVLFQMLSGIGETSEFFKYMTPITLFNPEKIAQGDRQAMVQFIVLYVVGILFYGVGIKLFEKKDLSI